MLQEYAFCKDLFEKYGLDLSEKVYNQLDIYAEFLVEYNKNVNLTAITDANGILIKHFLDSILLDRYCKIPENASLIDVGTGAGFPSIPLKIYRDDLKITLLDSLNKRITFLKMLCDKLEIDADFIHGRAEDIGQNPKYRSKFDVSCARAVANISLLSEYCIPFVKVGGSFISMKGPNEDISAGNVAVKLLGGEIADDILYNLEEESRRIVVIKKISQTPTKYPRNSGQIKKNPL